jgi:putative ABC transport system permease protein
LNPDIAARLPDTRFVPLAWRNLVSNKRRLIRSSAGIGFAVVLMLVQLGFERGFFDASLGMVRQLDGDLFVMRASKYRFGSEDPFAARDLDPARAATGVASVVPLYASWQRFFWKGPDSDKPYVIQAFAFDPEHPPFLLDEVRAQSDGLKGIDFLLIDRRSRPFLGMSLDLREAEVNGRKMKVAGSFALGPDFMANGTVMMSDRSFAELLTGNSENLVAVPVEFGVIKVQPGADIAKVRQALAAALPSEVRVLTKPELIDFERAFQADLSSAGPIFWMGTFVGFIVGMLISYQIIYTDLSDHLPQYATLKGMGYRTGYLVRTVFEQAALSAAAAYVPAWLLTLVLYEVIGYLALLPLHMTLRQTLLSFGLTLGMCLLSAALAIRRVIAADPAEVF